MGHQRPRSAFLGAGPEHQHPDRAVLADLRQNLGNRLAFTDHQFRVHALPVAHPFGKHFKMRLDPFAGLGAHQVRYAHPVLKLLGRDHREDLHPAAGMACPQRCKPHCVQAFAAVIQHDQKLAHDLLPEPRSSPIRGAAGKGCQPAAVEWAQSQ